MLKSSKLKSNTRFLIHLKLLLPNFPFLQVKFKKLSHLHMSLNFIKYNISMKGDGKGRKICQTLNVHCNFKMNYHI